MKLINLAGDYRSVGNRCSYSFGNIHSCFDEKARCEYRRERKEKVLHLESRGFKIIHVDVVKEARKLVGVGKWKLRSHLWDAPEFFNCSGLTRWVYGQKGIWLPRLAQRQYNVVQTMYASGRMIRMLNIDDARVGDLLFVSSPYSKGVYTKKNEHLHVCLVTGDRTVICATKSELGEGVVEIPLDTLFKTRKFRAVGRVDESLDALATLIVPPGFEIETSEDISYLLPPSLSPFFLEL